MSDDLSEFLLARIAAVERVAKAAAAGPWTVTEIYDDVFEVDDAHESPVAEEPSVGHGCLSPGNARHIAYWDPTRVLAECEAKRQIIAKHVPWPHNRRSDHGTPDCMTCIEDRDAWETHYELYPCPTLRYLTLSYADHPDYRQEWKP